MTNGYVVNKRSVTLDRDYLELKMNYYKEMSRDRSLRGDKDMSGYYSGKSDVYCELFCLICEGDEG